MPKSNSRENNPNTFPIGNRITEVRKLRGWTQDELAFRVGIQQSELSRYERGEHIPGILIGADIIKALEANANYILFGKGEKFID